MANSTSHSLPYPIRGARYSVPLEFFTTANVAADPTAPDTEYSVNGGATWNDCAEEVTTGGGNGMGYLTLTSQEMGQPLVLIASKSSNCKTSLATIRTQSLPAIVTGTLSAGSINGGTLNPILPYDVSGCFFRSTGGTGGGHPNCQARRINTYNTTTGDFTTTTVFETALGNNTTYEILAPTGSTIGMIEGMVGAQVELTTEAIDAIAAASAAAVIEAGGGGGGSAADLETQPIPVSRTLVFVETAEGMRSEDKQIITVGQPLQTYAADFRGDVSENQNVFSINAVEFIVGSPAGMLISDLPSWKRNGYTQARFQAAGVAPGEYVVRLSVTYGNPTGAGVGDLQFTVVP